MEYAILTPSARGYHSITIFNLVSINVVDLFLAVLLANPFRRTVVLDSSLLARTHLTNIQRRFILIDPGYNPIPTGCLSCLLVCFLLCFLLCLLLGDESACLIRGGRLLES